MVVAGGGEGMIWLLHWRMGTAAIAGKHAGSTGVAWEGEEVLVLG